MEVLSIGLCWRAKLLHVIASPATRRSEPTNHEYRVGAFGGLCGPRIASVGPPPGAPWYSRQIRNCSSTIRMAHRTRPRLRHLLRLAGAWRQENLDRLLDAIYPHTRSRAWDSMEHSRRGVDHSQTPLTKQSRRISTRTTPCGKFVASPLPQVDSIVDRQALGGGTPHAPPRERLPSRPLGRQVRTHRRTPTNTGAVTLVSPHPAVTLQTFPK